MTAPIGITFAYRVRYSVDRSDVDSVALMNQFFAAADDFAKQWAEGRGLVPVDSALDTNFKWPPKRRAKAEAKP